MRYYDDQITRETVVAACVELLPKAEDMLAEGASIPLVLNRVAIHCFMASIDDTASAIVRTALRNLDTKGTFEQ